MVVRADYTPPSQKREGWGTREFVVAEEFYGRASTLLVVILSSETLANHRDTKPVLV